MNATTTTNAIIAQATAEGTAPATVDATVTAIQLHAQLDNAAIGAVAAGKDGRQARESADTRNWRELRHYAADNRLNGRQLQALRAGIISRESRIGAAYDALPGDMGTLDRLATAIGNAISALPTVSVTRADRERSFVYPEYLALCINQQKLRDDAIAAIAAQAIAESTTQESAPAPAESTTQESAPAPAESTTQESAPAVV